MSVALAVATIIDEPCYFAAVSPATPLVEPSEPRARILYLKNEVEQIGKEIETIKKEIQIELDEALQTVGAAEVHK